MKLTGSLIVLLSCAILGNGQDSVSFLEPNCGDSISTERNSRARLNYTIVGGVPADMFGNPWMAWISSTFVCGGSLITARFVLSAAHCMTYHPTTVTLGEYDRSRSSPNAIEVPVDLQIPHPHYTNTKREKKNDIGLYRLARTVQYTDYIRPICLPTNYNPLAKTTYLTATGWGTTEHGKLSKVMKTTTLTQLNRGTCSSTFGKNVDISHICAGASNSDTCTGDSGGPISAIYPIAGRNRVIQLGLVSYGGNPCESVGVYTNVMHFMGWITYVVRRGGGQKTAAPTQRPNYYYPDANSPNYYPYYYPYYNPYYYPYGNAPNYYYYPNGNTPANYYNNDNSANYYGNQPGRYIHVARG